MVEITEEINIIFVFIFKIIIFFRVTTLSPQNENNEISHPQLIIFFETELYAVTAKDFSLFPT